jgi:hypothetical protein
MKENQNTTVTDAPQQKVWELQSELNVNEMRSNDDQSMSADDIKFVGEFGWLAAAAVLVTSIAAGL